MNAMAILESFFRWIHIGAGVVWIGHLYFFNWVNANFAPTISLSRVGVAGASMSSKAFTAHSTLVSQGTSGGGGGAKSPRSGWSVTTACPVSSCQAGPVAMSTGLRSM